MALGARRDQFILVGLAIALLLPFLIRAERRGSLRIHPVLIFLGGASYSFYLAHALALRTAAKLLANPFWYTAFGVTAGIVYYLVFERLTLKAFSKRIPIGASDPKDQ